MISKRMYKVLKRIPHYPFDTSMKKLREKHHLDFSEVSDILKDALSCKYISFTEGCFPNVMNGTFYLTEVGQMEIEAFDRENKASAKSTWALVIAGLSLAVSIIAIIVTCIVK